MKPSMFTPTLAAAALALALASCASRPAEGPAAAAPGATPARVVELPGSPGAGEPREARVLVDEPALKLVTIILRGGTVLPEHTSPVWVTIQALEGSGTVVTGSERHRVDRAHAVVLAPDVAHAVEPAPGTDLVLLVHHHGRKAGGHDHHE